MSGTAKASKQTAYKFLMARRRRLKKRRRKSKMAIHTGNEGHECEIEWTVQNILKLVKVTFHSRLSWERTCNSRFNLIVRIDSTSNGHYSDVNIGFQRFDSLKELTRLCFDVTIQNTSGDVYKREKGSLIYPTDGRTQWCMTLKATDRERFEDPDIITEDSLRDTSAINFNLVSKKLMVWDENRLHSLYVLLDDALVLKGVVNVYGCCLTSHLLSPAQLIESDSMITMTDLMQDFKFAFESGLCTDLELNVEGELVLAHKFVLAARSPVFRRLLQRRDERGETTPINVKIKKHVLEPFLKYMYVGIVGEVRWATVVELYEAGVWFEVPSLKQHCSRVLAAKVCERKVCQVLRLADKYDDGVLKKASVDYIKNNFVKVKDTEHWSSLIHQCPALASEVLEEITASLQ